MEYLDDEFQFCLEVLILKRNKDGATLAEIRRNLSHFIQILISITNGTRGPPRHHFAFDWKYFFSLSIAGDFESFSGLKLERIWGYDCWEKVVKPFLTNVVTTIITDINENELILYRLDCNEVERLYYDLMTSRYSVCDALYEYVKDSKIFNESVITRKPFKEMR